MDKQRLKKFRNNGYIFVIVALKKLLITWYLISASVCFIFLFNQKSINSAKGMLFQNLDNSPNYITIGVWSILAIGFLKACIDSSENGNPVLRNMFLSSFSLEPQKEVNDEKAFLYLAKHLINQTVLLVVLSLPMWALSSLDKYFYYFALILVIPLGLLFLVMIGYIAFIIYCELQFD